MNDFRCTIARQSWRIKFVPTSRLGRGQDGMTTPGHKLIQIRSRLRGRRLMETVVHEVLHAEHWQIDEEYVERTAADIARILHRLGFRHPGVPP